MQKTRHRGAAVTDERFEELVAEAFERIPPHFHELQRNVEVVIEAEPSPDLLAELDITPPDTLYGLYHGTPLTERESNQVVEYPDIITIYREPILEDYEDEDEVFRAIGETLIHEFGHHFGLSEEEIDEAEAIWIEDVDDVD